MKTICKIIQKLWTSSIRRQLMLGIILVHAILMSIFVYDLVERQSDFLHSQSIEQAKSLVKTLATNSSSWVLANDVIGLEEIVEAQINYPSLRYAMILSPEGRVLGHTDLEKVGLYVNDSISRKLLKPKKEQIILVNNDLSIDIASPIISNNKFIAWARVSLTQQATENNLQVITRNGLIYTLIAIFIGALFAYFMAKGITRGLQHIVDVAEGIKEGDQTLRADISRHDEIGKLGKDFNLMLDTIDQNKRNLQEIMDHSPAIIHVKDIEGRFTFINRKFLTLYGMKADDVIGKTLNELFPQDVADEIQRNDSDVINTGQSLDSEEVAPHTDGEMHTYVSTKFPLIDEDGKVYAVCGISTDITDRIKIENEKLSLEQQLRHTQKMQAIGQLTGGIAHDFNNLLAVILGYSELINDIYASQDETLNEYINQILIAGGRGRTLIEQMMIFSRKDQSSDEVETINPEETLLDGVKMLEAALPSGINIKKSFQKNVPYVNSSAGLISQVFLNLCMNAKDSMGKEGELFISLELETFNDVVCSSCMEHFSGEYVVIGVKDSGDGIPEEIIERMFEPFFTLKKVGKGTGMGLSVVHGIMHNLNGHIIVNSKAGEGASFKILLPVPDEQIRLQNNKEIKKAQYDFSGLNIMIVDDEPAIANFLEASLKNFNATVKIFTNSEEALASFTEQPEKFDIVITDQTMPGLTGVELSKKFMALRPEIKIILCTGYSAEVNEQSALQMGFKSFMNKPVDLAKLYKVINELR